MKSIPSIFIFLFICIPTVILSQSKFIQYACSITFDNTFLGFNNIEKKELKGITSFALHFNQGINFKRNYSAIGTGISIYPQAKDRDKALVKIPLYYQHQYFILDKKTTPLISFRVGTFYSFNSTDYSTWQEQFKNNWMGNLSAGLSFRDKQNEQFIFLVGYQTERQKQSPLFTLHSPDDYNIPVSKFAFFHFIYTSFEIKFL